MNKKNIPPDMRTKLEDVRLEALAISRSLDTLGLKLADLPPQLQDLFELDADFAEALWALDQPAKALKFDRMLKDTEASLRRWPQRVSKFTAALDPVTAEQLERRRPAVHATLEPRDAYRDVPGAKPRKR